jgi:ABC-type transport system involved in multi-copper enzyme maturation permease subunit
MGIMGVLFVFFSVIWLFISVAVGVYFYENGNSILISIVYSILFQLISFILVSLIALLASKKTESLKMLNNIKESTKQQG